MFLQEIWLPYNSEKDINKDFGNFSFQISTPDMFMNPEDMLSSPDHTWHGSAIAWHHTLDSFIENISTSNERFTGVLLNFPGLKLLAISVYFPTSGKDDEFLDCIANLSNFIAENITEDREVLIGTDSNCSEKSSSRRYKAFSSFCDEFSLAKHTSSSPTFHHPNGTSESSIDLFLVTAKSKLKILHLLSICTLDNPLNFSSHDPITASLEIPITKTNINTSTLTETYSKFEQNKILWNSEFIPKYEKLSEEFLSKCELIFPNNECIPLKCSLMSNLLVKSADLCFDHVKPCRKRKKNVSKRMENAWDQLQSKFNQWKKAGKPKEIFNKNFQNYKTARGNFQRVRREELDRASIQNNNTIMHCDGYDHDKMFKIMKRIRGDKFRTITNKLVTPVGTYYGDNVLEGFAADAEHLGKFVGECSDFDNDFYRLCIVDNTYIFDFKGDEAIKIPEMQMKDLNKIIFKDMKANKACDIYLLTVEHLRNAGDNARKHILNLVNDIINNIYYLTCPQVKKGLSTVIHKAKKKPVTVSSSYRRITVTPQIGGILDRYIDPVAEKIFQQVQSPDQFGFTKNISYLLGAVLRGECQRWALDKKLTCFGVSFDGQAAFPSVDRDIQVRELYSIGERGDYLEYSRNTYENTSSQIKLQGNLSREFHEFKGSRQGHKRAAGHFKSYINPCLNAANSSNLGFFIGPHCVSVLCIADDTYVLSDNPRKLQGLINIVGHYGKRYRLVFGADKTKITVTGSKIDMEYYRDINIWSLYEDKIAVTEDNDHLGLTISGSDEEAKNVDRNLQSTRNSMFSLLGHAFSFKCKLAPTVQLHIWTIYCKPVLRSGLAALPIRPTTMKSISTFHHSVLRGFLKLSPASPIPSLYFLLGEPPLEASLHMDVLILFWNLWSNPQTKLFQIVKYILMMTDNTSVTWTAHVRILCLKYQLPDPLKLLDGTLWPKERWKKHIESKILAYHEADLRAKAQKNTKLTFLNVQLRGLSGRCHPVLAGVNTTQDVVKLRPHLKMLAGDYLSFATLARERGGDPRCRICTSTQHGPAPAENLVHILTMCRGTEDTRQRILPELLNTVLQYFPSNQILVKHDHQTMTQFILDCSSPNLANSTRIDQNHPDIIHITRICRNMCYGIHSERIRKLKSFGLIAA